MSFFSLDILTPDKILGRNIKADSLFVPTVKGEINILPEHTHIISKIDVGSLKIVRDGKEEKYFLTTGVLKVLKEKVTILVLAGEKASEINLERAEKAFEYSQKKLDTNESLSDQLLEKYRRKNDRARIRIELAKEISK